MRQAANTGALPAPLHVQTALRLKGGAVLDLGTGVPTPAQLKASGTSSVPLSLPPLAALYNPGSGRWVPASPLHSARLFYTATLLTAGQVLVAGGAGAHTTLGSADLYTPAAVQP